MESQLAIEYGVESDDITIDTTFTTTGAIDIDVPDDITDNEVETILQNSIANSLGVHPSKVEVNLDPSTGDAIYTIISDDENTASTLRDALESSSFRNDLNDEISETLPTVRVIEVSTENEPEMEILVIIDASESNVNVEDTNARVIESLEDEGFSASAETSFITARPTLAPAKPSITPTIDGNILLF